MKTTIITTSALTALLLAACGKQDPSTTAQAVPDVVVRSFQAAYPEVEGATWKHDEEGFEAEWKVDGMERAVVYDDKGTVLITEEQVTEAQMPGSIQPFLAEKHPGLAIVKVGKETKSGTTTYEVELDNGGQELELIFDLDGNYLGSEADDADGEEDQD